MWYFVEPGTTDKRVLSTDDARGVCAIYPPDAIVPACAANLPDDGCGCRTAAHTAPWPACCSRSRRTVAARRQR